MSRLFVGIDVGKRKHEATLVTIDGETVGKSLPFDNSQQGVENLLAWVNEHPVDQVVYGLEATGHYWLALYTALTAAGCEVKVINPIQSDSLRNLYIRVTKNDRKDSFLIAQILRFGQFTETKLADEPMIQLRELSRMRVELVESVAGLKNRIAGLLDRVFPEFERLFSNPTGATAVKVLTTYPTPAQLAECDLEELTLLLQETSHGRLGRDKAERLQAAAKRSFGVMMALDAFTLEIRLLIDQMTFIEGQVKQINDRLQDLMREHQLILSIPGIGPVLGAAILGEIGDISRFPSGKHLRAYAGLDVTVYQSGEFQGSRARLSKRGSPYLRRALWMAASIARVHDPVFREFYQDKLAQGKHPKQAIGAVAGKLCNVLYAVLLKGESYDPNYKEKTLSTT